MPNLLLAQKIAEGGSPLYSFTVQESLAGLKSTGKEKAASEGQVCPHCGKVHPPAQTVPHTNAAAGTVSALSSVGTIAGKYYYCDKCKVYHQAQALPIVPKVPNPGAILPHPLNTNTSPSHIQN
ncbi:MAG TPA: hypothetical protein P5186_03145 [Candidatus Paceibacterota bacterium]|nr:hypothetical protein [Candidatus Paceibacterota bacterium]